jgi:2-polyprenyl-3-methyl-5-hydroxy-6-metoxy-1,4-benzoquinol methylase
VFANDFSSSGKQKAMALAHKKGISFEYELCDILEYSAEPETFDAIALIFAHFSETIREIVHKKMISLLKPSGWIILEGFNKKQLGKNSGGPKSMEMLFDTSMLMNDFEKCEIESLEEKTVFLKEGQFHEGEAEVIRGLFRKKN